MVWASCACFWKFPSTCGDPCSVFWAGARRRASPAGSSSPPGRPTPGECSLRSTRCNPENVSRSPHLRGFCHYPHRRGDADSTVARLYSKCKSRDSPVPPRLNVMYCVRVSLRTVKIFLAQHQREGVLIVSNLCISLNIFNSAYSASPRISLYRRML
jgi:hypothetical protein